MICATCGKPANPQYRPFCSRRCADVDLARWLNESYAIPAEAVEENASSNGEDGTPRSH